MATNYIKDKLSNAELDQLIILNAKLANAVSAQNFVAGQAAAQEIHAFITQRGLQHYTGS